MKNLLQNPTHRSAALRLLLTFVVALFIGSPLAVAALNSQEQLLANLLVGASGQQRVNMTLDPILSKVARERAADMAKRRYFGHTNPDGHGANYLVRQAGYILPPNYPADGNNIESIAAGQPNASSAWSEWMSSAPHKQHLLGQLAFYASQTAYGVGFYSDPSSEYGTYWVVITAPPMEQPPTISITAPADSVTTSVVSVSGTTGGTKPAASVRFRVENAAGVGGWIAANGTKPWSGVSTTLAPGPNTLRAQSLNADGSVMKETTRVVHYVVLTDLTVNVVGSGTITAGFAGTTQRALGESYTITATAAPGFLFAGWTDGTTKKIAPALKFTMTQGLTLTATFIPNPFLDHKGAYNGLITGNGGNATSGFAKITMTAVGRFTGQVVIGGKTYNFAGGFDVLGDATVTILRTAAKLPPLVVTLHADLEGATQQITGSITDGTFTASITTDRARQLEEGASPLAGRYTLTLVGDTASTDPTIPHGHGYATVLVTPAASARITGTLADGRAFSRTATVSKDGALPVYAALYSNTGSLTGVLNFRATDSSDIDGTLHWSKPERLLDATFKAAFEIDLPTIGSRYAAPTIGSRVISAADAANNVEIGLGGGNLKDEIAQPATLGADNRVIISTPQLPSLTTSITVSTGRFTGTFKHPVTGTVRRFNGVIFQKQNAGFGYFLDADASGFSSLAPVAAQ